jgi:predicted RNA-binding Zn-ribbon protein involved in translation (DUF1610 family)
MSNDECDGLIEFRKSCGSSTEGRGFSRATILHYTCPKCGQLRLLRKNWRGQTPPGGIRCGNRKAK